jgi:hypothetical protein
MQNKKAIFSLQLVQAMLRAWLAKPSAVERAHLKYLLILFRNFFIGNSTSPMAETKFPFKISSGQMILGTTFQVNPVKNFPYFNKNVKNHTQGRSP